MTRRYTKTNPRPPMTVEEGTAWKITYSPADRDFAAVIEDAGTIGLAQTQHEARLLIAEYYIERHTPETAAAVVMQGVA